MGVHPSNATRACDRLVAAGLLDRRDNPADRRHLLLTLTDAGRELVDGVMDRRRVAIGQILQRMPPEDRAQLATVLTGSPRPAENPRTPTCGRSAGPPNPPAGQQVPARVEP